jgi:hypothetical protein
VRQQSAKVSGHACCSCRCGANIAEMKISAMCSVMQNARTVREEQSPFCVIDATHMGNMSKLFNHCCSPNVKVSYHAWFNCQLKLQSWTIATSGRRPAPKSSNFLCIKVSPCRHSTGGGGAAATRLLATRHVCAPGHQARRAPGPGLHPASKHRCRTLSCQNALAARCSVFACKVHRRCPILACMELAKSPAMLSAVLIICSVCAP